MSPHQQLEGCLVAVGGEAREEIGIGRAGAVRGHGGPPQVLNQAVKSAGHLLSPSRCWL
jgi:hypothetical protein